MPGLILKLGPGERVMVNGVVMENGPRRTRINILTPQANVLRLRDAIHPDQVNTPVRRVCYIAQMVLAGEADDDEGRRQMLLGIEQLGQVFTDPDSCARLSEAMQHVGGGRFYQALKTLRTLLPREQRLLQASAVPAEAPA